MTVDNCPPSEAEALRQRVAELEGVRNSWVLQLREMLYPDGGAPESQGLGDLISLLAMSLWLAEHDWDKATAGSGAGGGAAGGER